MVNRRYKDSMFRFIFSDPAELCPLYHAISPESGITIEDIRINTLDSILMDRLKNDISFLHKFWYVILMEQQSTWSPNMPLRCLWYVSDLYRHIVPNKKAMYGNKLIRIPAPKFYVFYIGDNKQPNESTFLLSDAFSAPSPQLELQVTVYNITYDPSRPILQKCRTLHDYSFFLNEIEGRKKYMPLDMAIRQSMSYCETKGILEKFIRNHNEEVCNMVTLWYDEKEAREYWREEAMEEIEAAREAARKAVREAAQREAENAKKQQEQQEERRVLAMLRDKFTPDVIAKYSPFSLERIQELGRTHQLL